MFVVVELDFNLHHDVVLEDPKWLESRRSQCLTYVVKDFFKNGAMMENVKDEDDKDYDGGKSINDPTTKDLQFDQNIPKWAFKTNDISGSKVHLLSISTENLSPIELGSNRSLAQIGKRTAEGNISTPDTSIEMNMYQRKIDKEDSTIDSRNDSQANDVLNGQAGIISDDLSSISLPNSIFTNNARNNDEEDGNDKGQKKELSIKLALVLLLIIFSVCLGALAFVYSSFPKMDQSESKALKFPTNIDDAKLLGQGMLYIQNEKDK